jgi:hypothetical protein
VAAAAILVVKVGERDELNRVAESCTQRRNILESRHRKSALDPEGARNWVPHFRGSEAIDMSVDIDDAVAEFRQRRGFVEVIEAETI